MTADEVCERYQIPAKILKEYHDWGLCDAVRMAMDDWQYSDKDLERLGMIMALHDIGFQKKEVEEYMKFLLNEEQTKIERMKMLDDLRNKALDQIHLRERQLMRMDYLRKEIKDSFKKK